VDVSVDEDVDSCGSGKQEVRRSDFRSRLSKAFFYFKRSLYITDMTNTHAQYWLRVRGPSEVMRYLFSNS